MTSHQLRKDRIATVPPQSIKDPVAVAEVFLDRSFRALWAAVGVSQVGSAVSLVTVPLIAAITLHAAPAQMAWLAAMKIAPSLLVSVPAGAWSDSLRAQRVPFMVGCNLIQ